MGEFTRKRKNSTSASNEIFHLLVIPLNGITSYRSRVWKHGRSVSVRTGCAGSYCVEGDQKGMNKRWRIRSGEQGGTSSSHRVKQRGRPLKSDPIAVSDKGRGVHDYAMFSRWMAVAVCAGAFAASVQALLWQSAAANRRSVLTHGDPVVSTESLRGRWHRLMGARRGVWGGNARDGRRVTGGLGTVRLAAGTGQVDCVPCTANAETAKCRRGQRLRKGNRA